MNIFMGRNVSKESNQLFSICSIIIALKLYFIINIGHSLSWNLYEIYLTQIYHFTIQPRVPTEISLSTAMSLYSHPYIQVFLNNSLQKLLYFYIFSFLRHLL